MKITVNDFVLSEMGGPVGVREFTMSGARSVEAARFLRAANGAFFDRHNQTVTITFMVSRLHGSVRDAELFLLAHEADVPASGLVTFTARSDSGREVARYLDAAIVEVTQSAYIGCATTTHYKISGATLLIQRPG